MSNSSIHRLVITPEEARDLAHSHVDSIISPQKKRGALSGLSGLDKVVSPLLPGRLMTIMGRPGNGKTSLMAHYVREASLQRTKQQRTKESSPPIFVSAEMSVEEIAIREISRVIPIDSLLLERGEYGDWSKVHDAIDKICEEYPVVYIAHSLQDSSKRPRMSVEVITSAVSAAVDHYGAAPDLIAVDYAQRLKLDKATRDRRIEVSEITETMKDMALAFSTGVILGSQVGRHVDAKRPPIPELADAKETANLEETSDVILSVMRPSKYYQAGDIIPGTTFKCVDELFYIYVVKQRQGVSGKGMWVWFDMAISRLSDLEIQRTDFEDY